MKKLYLQHDDEAPLFEAYKQGLIGAWNGAYLSDGTFYVTAHVHHPRAKAMLLDVGVTVMPDHTDSGSVVEQKHFEKLKPEVVEKLELKAQMRLTLGTIGAAR